MSNLLNGSENSTLLVTGGAGFIGSAFIRMLLRSSEFTGKILNVDKLTYAANLANLNGFLPHPRYKFIQADINQTALIERLCEDEAVDIIVHFAAETHVDRSIASAEPFVEANIRGTMSLLEVLRKNPQIHLHHVSTDEVYGSLGESGHFTEQSHYRPNSPYAATKAASDHLVRAYALTYQLSTTLSHCSNNYGPGQYPEKFIPLMISNCLSQKPLPLYGRGTNIRDWLYVDDHAEAIWAILKKGRKGETYDIGGGCEFSNKELLEKLIETLAAHTKTPPYSYRRLIRFVTDRPGHDFRYAIDGSKIKKELNWHPRWPFEKGLKKTIQWYIGHTIVVPPQRHPRKPN